LSLIKNGEQLRKIIDGSYYKISPDGKTLAYTSGGQIWTLSFTDTAAKPEKLFQSRGSQSQICWSPDGKMIAFVSNRVTIRLSASIVLPRRQLNLLKQAWITIPTLFGHLAEPSLLISAFQI
jgi:WD40 repeat protein